MMMKLAKKLKDQERGFTLIELMVVVLIIAILIAIAIPAFLGARKRAQRRQAQSALRNTLTTEKTYYADAQKYITDSAGDLTAIEPNIEYVVGVSDDPNLVSILVSGTDDQFLEMAAWSKSKDCYYIQEDASAGTTYSKTETGAIESSTGCDADDAPGATLGPW
jgi:type IV pilus assembly protein PilA